MVILVLTVNGTSPVNLVHITLDGNLFKAETTQAQFLNPYKSFHQRMVLFGCMP